MIPPGLCFGKIAFGRFAFCCIVVHTRSDLFTIALVTFSCAKKTFIAPFTPVILVTYGRTYQLAMVVHSIHCGTFVDSIDDDCCPF